MILDTDESVVTCDATIAKGRIVLAQDDSFVAFDFEADVVPYIQRGEIWDGAVAVEPYGYVEDLGDVRYKVAYSENFDTLGDDIIKGCIKDYVKGCEFEIDCYIDCWSVR